MLKKLLIATKGISIECMVKLDPCFSLINIICSPAGFASIVIIARSNISLKGSSSALKGLDFVPNSILLNWDDGSI